MEREIIFRGKRTDKGEWVEGSLVQMLVDGRIASCIAPIEEVGRANKDVPPMGILYTLNKDIFIVHPDTIGQYTGMIDKNGNKIFEGDILENHHPSEDVARHKVKFEVGMGCYVAILLIGSLAGFFFPFGQSWIENYDKVIVGNIHDNPELLKGGDK